MSYEYAGSPVVVERCDREAAMIEHGWPPKDWGRGSWRGDEPARWLEDGGKFAWPNGHGIEHTAERYARFRRRTAHLLAADLLKAEAEVLALRAERMEHFEMTDGADRNGRIARQLCEMEHELRRRGSEPYLDEEARGGH